MITDKKVGIWGLGVVGRSALQLLSATNNITVMERRELSQEDRHFLATHNAQYLHEDSIDHFFNSHDIIIPSPGITIDTYIANYKNKIVTELDLFYQFFTKPIIAVTGSIGKTTVTSFLHQLLTHYNRRVACGGNIGIGMLDLIQYQDNVDYALIEVSSFQLEHCHYFRPAYALWTNLVPNHLDRHKTMEAYFSAKYQILQRQTPADYAIVPFSCIKNIKDRTTQSQQIYTHAHRPSCDELHLLSPNDVILYCENQQIIQITYENNPILLCTIPSISHAENWLTIVGALMYLNCGLSELANYTNTLNLPAHRMEKITTIENVTFYNDSKATTIESTIAAVRALQPNFIHLFLGGLSKGIDRASLIEAIKPYPLRIYTFGAQADLLYFYAQQADIPASSHQTLDAAFNMCIEYLRPDDIVLLSPSGSSYDLFAHYEERGEHFKQLVRNYQSDIKQRISS